MNVLPEKVPKTSTIHVQAATNARRTAAVRTGGCAETVTFSSGLAASTGRRVFGRNVSASKTVRPPTSSSAFTTRNFCGTDASERSFIEAMPRMISQARAKVSARKKIQPRQDSGDELRNPERGDGALIRRRNDALQDEVEPVQAAPGDERPVRAVPQAAQEHGQHQLARRLPRAAAVSAER